MKEEKENIYPFKVLDSYKKEDIALFGGRDVEVDILFKKIEENNIILVYGFSGVGKTSLISCGLANKFETYNWFPLHVRRGDNINESLISTIETALNLNEEEKKFYFKELRLADVALEEKVKLLYNLYHIPIYFIFDQFEELFISQEVTDESIEEKEFTKNLLTLQRINVPIKIILSMREEYIGQLYKIEDKIPEIKLNKFRVEFVGHKKVFEIITKATSFSLSNYELREGEEKEICKQIFKLIKGEDSIKGAIDLIYLQVFLQRIFLDLGGDKLTSSGKVKISLDFLSNYKGIGNILRDFLDEKRDEIKKEISEIGKRIEIVDEVLLGLVTNKGTKKSVHKEKFKKEFSDFNLVEKVLMFFDKRGIIDSSSDRYELKHDSLAKRIDEFRSVEDKHLLYLIDFISSHMMMTGVNRNLTENQLASILNSEEKLIDLFEKNNQNEHIKYIESNKTRIKQEKQEKQEKRRRESIRNSLILAVICVLGYYIFQLYLKNSLMKQNAEWEKKLDEKEERLEQQRDSLSSLDSKLGEKNMAFVTLDSNYKKRNRDLEKDYIDKKNKYEADIKDLIKERDKDIIEDVKNLFDHILELIEKRKDNPKIDISVLKNQLEKEINLLDADIREEYLKRLKKLK